MSDAVAALAPQSHAERGAFACVRVAVAGAGSWAERVRVVVLPVWRELGTGTADGADLRLRLVPARAELDVVELDLSGEAARVELAADALGRRGEAAGAEVAVGASPTDADLPGDWALSADGRVVSAFREAMAAATDICLAGMEGSGGERPPYPDRQRALLAMVVQALPAAFAEPSERRAYLAFHRDWLIRHPVLVGGHGSAKVNEVFAVLNAQAERMGAPSWDDLVGASAGAVPPASAARWTSAMRALADAVASHGRHAAGRVDPFAGGALSPLVFRALHAAARLLGIATLDESFLHHLARRALGDGDGRAGFRLTPHAHLLPEPEAEEGGKAPGSFEEGYPWRELVGASGEEGRAWLSRYRESEKRVGRSIDAALQLMRKGRLEEGREHLRELQAHRAAIRDESRGVYHVLGRFYHGELAYYLYATGDLPGAEREMEAAAASVRKAIETHRFLLPIAPLAVDIPLQKARIARRQREWDAMEAQLDLMYRMETGRHPLLVLSEGTPVDYAVLHTHFSGLELSEAERRGVERMLDEGSRLRDLRQLTLRLYALSDVVIPIAAA